MTTTCNTIPWKNTVINAQPSIEYIFSRNTCKMHCNKRTKWDGCKMHVHHVLEMLEMLDIYISWFEESKSGQLWYNASKLDEEMQ